MPISQKLNRVHIKRELTPKALSILMEDLDSSIKMTYGEEIPNPSDYQILVDGVPSREIVEGSPLLRCLIIPWAGLPTATRELMLDFPTVAVHNLHHNAAPTAEMAIALMFAAAKYLVSVDRVFRNHDWSPRYQPRPSLLLEGKTALILGYGAIGRHTGRVLYALGMQILGVQKNPRPDEFAKTYSLSDLPNLLPKANVLILTIPLTPETQGLIDEKELSALPAGSLLVNVGRGGVVDQWALYNALKNGHLAGAGLDVWYNYPKDEDSRSNTPPADAPLHELENIIMSPHRGGSTFDTERLRMTYLAKSLNAAVRGEPIPNPVNLEAGY